MNISLYHINTLQVVFLPEDENEIPQINKTRDSTDLFIMVLISNSSGLVLVKSLHELIEPYWLFDVTLVKNDNNNNSSGLFTNRYQVAWRGRDYQDTRLLELMH